MPGSATREKALQAALELFGRTGYDRVSMNDIAEAVGIRAVRPPAAYVASFGGNLSGKTACARCAHAVSF